MSFLLKIPLGMYSVRDNVSEWKEGSSHGPEPVLWRRKCINNTTGRCKSLWSMFLYMSEFLVSLHFSSWR